MSGAALSSAAPALIAACLRAAAGGRTMRSRSDIKNTGTNKRAALYVGATPMGTLADITLRALEVLRGVDAIACEDTRHARRLLDHYGIIAAATFALHEHNEREASAKLVDLLREGKSV